MKLPQMILTACLTAVSAGICGCGTAGMASGYSMASLEGVWMNYKLSSGGTALTHVRYIVFDGEGYFIDAFPRKGLHGIAADDLSQYTISTRQDRPPGAATPYTSYVFEWTGVNTLTHPGYTYQFQHGLVKNNLRLSGSWTTFQTTDDPRLDEPGVRFVLILNYSDVCLVKRSFTGAVGKNPSGHGGLFYIGGKPVYKR